MDYLFAVLADEGTVIDLCSGNSDQDDMPEPLLLTSGIPRSHVPLSTAPKAGGAADGQQLAMRGQPSSPHNANQRTTQGQGRVKYPTQTDGQGQRRRKSDAPVKIHRRAPKQTTIGLTSSQQDVTGMPLIT